jgi:membrane-bound ClpP family serine protease
MDAFVVVALLGVALLVAELLLPTGGVLATLGAIGLIVGGILALDSSSDAADVIGPALITMGVLSIVCFYFITRKVIAAHRDEPIRTGSEELVGGTAEVRSPLEPIGQVFAQGTIWGARLRNGARPVPVGSKVRIESVDGLTLVVEPDTEIEEGAN